MSNPKTRSHDTAFPTSEPGDPGLTKREYFAAMAMAHSYDGRCKDFSLAAQSAVRAADALIDALNAGGDE